MSYGIKEDQNVPRKKHTPEEIVAKLRQVDVLVSQGMPVADAVRQISVTQQTYYRWRKQYGGMSRDHRGRTAIVSPSMPASGTNFSMVRSSTRCGRLRSLSSNGGDTTTPSGRAALSDTIRQRPRASFSWTKDP
jgi:hypothetical protein